MISGQDNRISFSSNGNGIDADGGIAINLKATNNNEIYNDAKVGPNGGDGINIGANQSENILLEAYNINKIEVSSDGIFVSEKAKKEGINVTLNAITGNNNLTTGNNGIDHNGSCDVILTANSGANIIKGGMLGKTVDDKGNPGNQGDGIRIAGAGDVRLEAKYNSVSGFDEGIYVSQKAVDNGITLIAKDVDKDGFGNRVSGKDNGIQVDGSGNVYLTSYAGANYVYGAQNAVYNNGSGTIQIIASANADSIINSINGISTLAETNANNNDDKYNNYFIANSEISESGLISSGTGKTYAIADDNNIIAGTKNGILSNDNGEIYVWAGNNNTIGQYSYEDEDGKIVTITSETGINAEQGTINVTAEENNVITASDYGINASVMNGNTNVVITGATNTITSISGNDDSAAIYAKEGATITIEAKAVDGKNIGNWVDSEKDGIVVENYEEDGVVDKNTEITFKGNTVVNGLKNGIIVDALNVINNENNNITVDGDLYAMAYDGHSVNLKNNAKMYVTGNEIINNTMLIEQGSYEKIDGGLYTSKVVGMPDKEGEEAELKDAVVLKENAELVVGHDVNLKATGTAIDVSGISSVGINQNNNNYDNYIEGAVEKIDGSADSNAIKVTENSTVQINGNNNTVIAGKVTENEATHYTNVAINAQNGSNVTLSANLANRVGGAVYAKDAGTTVDIQGTEGKTAQNNIYSNAIIKNAGDLAGQAEGGTDVISALYAEDGATINLSGINNIQTYYVNPSDPDTSERVVWAYDDATIDIDGYTYISTSKYYESPEAKDIAIAAGTATDLDANKDFGNNYPEASEWANVTLDYENYNNAQSSITGDILAAYAGNVDINAKNADTDGLDVNGDLLSGNGGTLSVDFGNGGTWTGRADSYIDAGTADDYDKHKEFYSPAFSSSIITGGDVEVFMNNGKWFVDGQSWLNTFKADNTEIYMNAGDTTNPVNSVMIEEMNGSGNTFYMTLDNNNREENSDMLYIKGGNADFDVVVNGVINGLENVTEENGLRFATVGSGITLSQINVDGYGVIKGIDGGAFNTNLYVKREAYDVDNAYNEDFNGGNDLTADKPGSSTVEDFFELNENTEEEVQAKMPAIMMLAENEEVQPAVTSAADTLAIVKATTNGLTDAGKTMVAMSKANYSNAIYMDRLNKRVGEAKYLNGEDEDGMWLRIRHDRIGKDDAFRSQNTMYELGYDVKQPCDNGERRIGMAVDYMHGDTGYKGVAGKGEIDRYGLWLYDTWMGDKGHYVDYVAKWGHLSNDFEVYNSIGKVTGDYSNNVFSVSAEYGKKNDIGNGWFIEPQIQAQLARVTGADYVNSQGTKVSADGINSLIGRAGFRLGKDFGEEKQSTVYIKADVLHEFMGDQDLRVKDGTTNGDWVDVGFENKGTWYDVGFGFATMMSKNSYAFLDLEKSFGHDNDETYQINAGVQWTF